MVVKKLRLKTAGPCFGDHIIPYHKAKMLYLSNLEKKFFRNAGALKLHFFGFSVLTIRARLFKTSLVNVSLNFQKLISQICLYFLPKNIRSFCIAKPSFILSTKTFSAFGYKVVKHLTS